MILDTIGKKVNNFFREFIAIIKLTINVILYIPRIFKDRALVIEQMEIVGANSLPLVLLIGTFTGAIAALQASSLFDKFNLLQIAKPFFGASIATAVFTELTPVLLALVIAGRVGASMTAQLGTMNVTEQLDALDMMAIDKNRFLAMPRLFAAITMMPILAIFSNVVALIGAYILIYVKFDFPLETYLDSIQNFFSMQEIFICLAKSVVFGGITAIIGVYVGFRTLGGAEGVGKSTVRAYTISAATILIIDALFGTIF